MEHRKGGLHRGMPTNSSINIPVCQKANIKHDINGMPGQLIGKIFVKFYCIKYGKIKRAIKN